MKSSVLEVFSMAELHAIMNRSVKSYFLTISAITSFSKVALVCYFICSALKNHYQHHRHPEEICCIILRSACT
jgi:hypothetical protein